MLSTLAQDLRFAIRRSLKNPTFSLVIVMLLGFGIGLNIAFFSVVRAVLLKPLPYRAPGKIVRVDENFQQEGLEEIPVSAPEFADYSKETGVFDGVSIYDEWQATFGSTETQLPQRFDGALVSSNLFDVLGVKPLLGRTPTALEERAPNNVIVLSYGLWKSRFNANPNIINQTVVIDTKSYRAIGVMGPAFYFPDVETQAWSPIPFRSEDFNESERGSRSYLMIARLRPGVTLSQARADIKIVASRWKAQHPNDYAGGWFITFRPLQQVFTGDVRKPLLMLQGAVGFILLIVCVNLAMLLLARSAVWRREMDIRAALGATRWRILAQFVSENGFLLVLGVSLGIGIARLGTGLIVTHIAHSVIRPEDVKLDGPVILFIVGISLLTGVVSGFGPALYFYSSRLTESLRQVQGTAGARNQQARNLLVIAEVALSTVLVAGSALMLRSLHNLRSVHTGFDPANVLVMRISLPPEVYDDAKRIAFYRGVLDRVSDLPGAHLPSIINQLPLGGGRSDRTFAIQGRTVTPESAPDEEYRVTSANYFRTLRIPLVRGRYFNGSDNENTPKVLIINESFARKYWPNGDPLGQQMAYYGGPGSPLEWREIVGIVADVRHFGLNLPPKPEVYVPYTQNPRASMTLLVNYSIVPASLAAEIRREILTVDKNQTAYDISSMVEVVSHSIEKQRLSTVLLTSLALVGLFLSSIGLYGAISYLVSQRIREFAVSMALGAQRSHILGSVIRKSMLLVVAGIVIGLFGALSFTRFLTSLLFNVATTDPVVFLAAPAVLCAVTLVACFLPAWRATKIDPSRALRYE